MAVVALTAIIESRTAVEREGRRAAEEVARQYGKELERPWGNLLIQQDRYSQRWCDWLSEVVGGWPGTERRAQIEREGARFPDLDPAAELAEWQAQYPGLRSEEVFPDSFGLMPDGRFQGGLEFDPAPLPPPWFLAFSPAQRAAWDALKGAATPGATAEEVDQRIAQFQEASPEPEAEVNALFIGLRAHLAMVRGKQAVIEALQFARENPEALSEAGLPLANLAYGEALRYGRTSGALQPLWEAIPGQVLRAPSPLVPELLDQLEELAGTNPALHAGVSAWRTLWNARLKLHDVAEAVRQSGKLHGLTTANVWIEHDEGRWLCLLNPAQSRLSQSAERGTVDSTNELWTEVRFVPKAVAEQSLVRALENSEVKLPGYLGLAAWLEGEPLTLPARWSPGRDTNAALAFLAEANGALSSPGKFRKGTGEPEVDWEILPSRPRFVLQLYMADPALLFSSYRRHALMLAGLVAASAFAALIGVLASWQAFQRQLRLSELKSNFVSSVSHELRAPLASVRLMAESLERGKVSDTPKQQEYFRFIVQECRRLSALIENVLDFSRIEQGRKQYDFEPTDLRALTEQTVKLMQTYAAERGVKLLLQRSPGAFAESPQPSTLNPQPSADGKALQQALVNLIDNALKHSPKGETVTVGLEVHSPKSTVHGPQSTATSQTFHVSRFTFHASTSGSRTTATAYPPPSTRRSSSGSTGVARS